MRSRFIEDHNVPRIQSIVKDRLNKPDSHKPAAVMIFTVPGVPFIQAGQEIGAIKGRDRDNPFPPVDWNNGDYTLRDFYKKLIKIYRENDALKYGTIENVWKSGDNAYAYLRSYEDEKVVVVINFLEKESTLILDLSFLPKRAILHDKLSDEKLVVDEPDNFKVTVSAYGSRILVVSR